MLSVKLSHAEQFLGTLGFLPHDLLEPVAMLITTYAMLIMDKHATFPNLLSLSVTLLQFTCQLQFSRATGPFALTGCKCSGTPMTHSALLIRLNNP